MRELFARAVLFGYLFAYVESIRKIGKNRFHNFLVVCVNSVFELVVIAPQIDIDGTDRRAEFRSNDFRVNETVLHLV